MYKPDIVQDHVRMRLSFKGEHPDKPVQLNSIRINTEQISLIEEVPQRIHGAADNQLILQSPPPKQHVLRNEEI